LKLDLAGDFVCVSEAVPGTALPAWCMERHINGDMTFCLGLDKPRVLDEAQATAFWPALRTYLLYQQFADRNRRWPPGRWMSHGDAAYAQQRAETAAQALGLAEDYGRALEFREGWLAGTLPRLVHARPAKRASTSCPLLHVGRRRALRLRDGCVRCLNLAALIEAEKERRREDVAFVATMRRFGYRCCRTMHNCALEEDDAHGQQTL